jgi:hypothetical protein
VRPDLESATFRLVARCLNHFATATPLKRFIYFPVKFSDTSVALLRSLTIHFKLSVNINCAALNNADGYHNTSQSGNDVQMMDELCRIVTQLHASLSTRGGPIYRTSGWADTGSHRSGCSIRNTVLKAASAVASCHSVLESQFGHV